MTRRAKARFAALLTALAGFTLAFCADSVWAQKPRAERPSYSASHQWMRSDGTYVLTRGDRDTYVFSAGPGNEIHLTKNLGIRRIVLDRRVEYDIDPAPGLNWPLEVGKWGTRQAAWRLPPPRALSEFTGSIRISFKVDAYEDVRVSAGSFKAFRISHSIETVPIQFGSGVHFGGFTLWYAPEIQLFVKAEGNFTGLNWELAGVHQPTPPVVGSPAPAPAPPAAAPPAAVGPTDADAPRIVINYPPADTKVESEQIVVLGVVSDNVGVDRVQVTVNGVEVPQERGMEGRGRAVRAPATLRPGENVIEITATDRAGNVAQAVRTVTRVSAAVAPAAPAAKPGDRWAVIIGVGSYTSPAIP